jgi:hypothetical protein
VAFVLHRINREIPQSQISNGYLSQIHVILKFGEENDFSDTRKTANSNEEQCLSELQPYAHDLSRNGTFINNDKIGIDQCKILKAGDILSLIRPYTDECTDRPCYAYRGDFLSLGS